MSATDKLEAIVGSTAYDLTDILTFSVEANDGFGLPPIERITERGPLQHGVTDKGFRLNPRILSLKIRTLPSDWGAYFTLRDTLLRIFKPNNAGIKIRRTINGTIIREAVFHTVDGGRFSSQNSAGISTLEVFQIEAPDPTLYDPTGLTESFELGAGGDAFTVPTPVPTGVGASTIDQVKAIAYPGSWMAFPIVRITGPLTNPLVLHTLTGDKLDFTGVTIAAGDWYEIDCAYGKKTVVDSTGVNRIASLTNDSDLATFAILPDPDAPGGNNSIRVTGSAANSQTRVDISYFVRYIGM